MMQLESPSLEGWFNRYQEGAEHQLGGTMIAPMPGDRLSGLLPTGWTPASFDCGYSSTPGSAALRAAIAAEDQLDPAGVILTAGATEANAATLAALIEPGSRVVLQDPLYYQFAALATALGAEVSRWTLPADPYEPADLEALYRLLDARTRLVVLNSPHNPTGRILPQADLQAIARHVEALPDAYLLVDEIYRGVMPDGIPSAAHLSPRALAVNAVSKRWSLPGLRLGWVATANPAVAARILAWHEHLTCSVSRTSEQLVEWLWPARRVIWEEHAAIATRNRARVSDWLRSLSPHAHGVMPPAGVMTLLWAAGEKDDIALARRLRLEHACFVIPGSCLGYPGALRIGFGHRDEAALDRALVALGQALGQAQNAPQLARRP